MIVFKDKPKIHLEWLLKEKLSLIFSISLVAISLILIFWNWSSIPDQIPIHFKFNGMPNKYGRKEMLFFLNFIGLFSSGLIYLVCLKPHLGNLPWQIKESNAVEFYRLMRMFCLRMLLHLNGFFLYLTWGIILVAKKEAVSLESYGIAVFMVLIFWNIFKLYTKGALINSSQHIDD